MARYEKMIDFLVDVPDKPGEVSKIAGLLKHANVNLLGIWAFGVGSGNGKIICVPENAEQFRSFARGHDLEFSEGITIYMTAEDRVGALVETLELIAAAGANMHAVGA